MGTRSASLSVFDLQSGEQIRNIAEEVRPDHFVSLDVSPSGSRAAVLFQSFPNDAPPRPLTDLTVIDLNAARTVANIQTGMTGIQAVLVGEEAVAVASAISSGSSMNKTVQLFRLDNGQVARSFGPPAGVAGSPIGASADGRFIMAYTGEESFQKDVVQIERARFTIWNASSGAVVAQSPPLMVSTVRVGLSDWALFGSSLRESIRPDMAFSQSGGAVLVSDAVHGGPVNTFTVTATRE